MDASFCATCASYNQVNCHYIETFATATQGDNLLKSGKYKYVVNV